MAKKITTIPATLDQLTAKPLNSKSNKRVAGYARVSTDNEDQANSYEAQVDYYMNYIKNRADWDFVKVYTDDGISGTSTAKRAGFNAMISDAKAGKIDLIVTKSVSRFARNTVDSLTTIRDLKDHGIEVFFEKENIWTFESSGELLLTIMSSISQEESRSISLNVTWGLRKGMQDGKVYVPYSNFLGYDKGEDGNLVVNQEQAEAVRKIFAYYIQGRSTLNIARMLTVDKTPTPKGGKKWSESSVISILHNEKYKGDALLQKTFTTNYLTKKQKVNEGEIPQYYVEGNHEAIIDPVVFDWVQEESKRRTKGYSSKYLFCSKIICGECGNVYGRKVWHSTSSSRKYVWMCNWKYKKLPSDPVPPSNPDSDSTSDGENGSTGNVENSGHALTIQRSCIGSPTLTEYQIQSAFLKAVNMLLQGRERAVAAFELAKTTVLDTSDLEIDLATVNAEIRSTSARMRTLDNLPETYAVDLEDSKDVVEDQDVVDDTNSSDATDALNTTDPQNRGDDDDDWDDYEDPVYLDISEDALNETRMAMRARMAEARERQRELRKKISNKKRRRTAIDEYLADLKLRRGRLTDFSAELFSSFVDHITVKKKGMYGTELEFEFLDGSVITVEI